jgi:hypothetical protein
MTENPDIGSDIDGMPKYSDIVEALRSEWTVNEYATHHSKCWIYHPACAVDVATAEIEYLRAECQKLANYLMSELVFVHERLIEEVDTALVPYLGHSTLLK